MILGLHCSIREGFLKALNYAESLKAEALQILPCRRHVDPEEEDYAGFVEHLSLSSVRRLFVHSRFVPNLALSEENKRLHSVSRLSHEISLAARLRADAFILHLGAYSELDSPFSGIAWAARSIAQAYGEADKKIPICVENVPGGGRRLGGTLEELAELGEALTREDAAIPLSFCLDTAHAWASGYSLSQARGMEEFLERAESLLGQWKIQVFHLNDTRADFGSHRENHALWGKGILGFEGLKWLLSQTRYVDRAGILESPRPGEAERNNFRTLKALKF